MQTRREIGFNFRLYKLLVARWSQTGDKYSFGWHSSTFLVKSAEAAAKSMKSNLIMVSTITLFRNLNASEWKIFKQIKLLEEKKLKHSQRKRILSEGASPGTFQFIRASLVLFLQWKTMRNRNTKPCNYDAKQSEEERRRKVRSKKSIRPLLTGTLATV